MAPPALPLLLLLLLLSHRYGHAAGAAAVSALDGFGRPVAWWVVLKLPMLAANGSLATCDCPPPDCSNVRADGDADQHGDANADQHERAAGLCYLYADARTPALRHFRDAGLDCLGQGGDDPLSHTLRQRHADDPDVYWALFNDQLDGIARPFEDQHGGPAPASPARTTCRGGDRFSAHAKGAAIFRVDHSDNQNDGQQQNDGRGQNAGRGGQNDGGGVFLQTSTPSFPDPSAVLNASAPFVRLGCQRDNNVLFAQHAAAISLGADAVDALADALRLARLCSANFYGGDLGRALASDNLRTAGAAGEPRVAAVYRALVDAAEPAAGGDADDAFVRRLRLPLRTPARSAAVFEPLVDQSPSLVDVNDQHGHQHGHQHEDQVEVEVLVKGPRAHAPPWALVAAALGADVSVASWWDEGFGIPSVCAGDAFAAAPHRFCLDDHHAGLHLLPPDARAPFNVENLIEATYVRPWLKKNDHLKWLTLFHVVIVRWTMRDGSGNLSWHLVGGRHARDGNHGECRCSS